jgi:ATP phosphoribosyltransferase regulatory subunit
VAQAGIELIGIDSPAADAEIVLVGAEALATLGLNRVSFDLTLPPLVDTLLNEAEISGPARAALTRALDRKDAAAVAALGGPLARTLAALLLAAGPSRTALDAMQRAELPPGAQALVERMAETVQAIHARAPALRLTVDPIEFRGFRYHTGVCVTIYAPRVHEELGRGGRYICGASEPATGLTLFPDVVLRAAPSRTPKPRVYVPYGDAAEHAAALRERGFATVPALAVAHDPAAEALRLGCTHLLQDGVPVMLVPE